MLGIHTSIKTDNNDAGGGSEETRRDDTARREGDARFDIEGGPERRGGVAAIAALAPVSGGSRIGIHPNTGRTAAVRRHRDRETEREREQ